jgi:hypothetical protein
MCSQTRGVPAAHRPRCTHHPVNVIKRCLARYLLSSPFISSVIVSLTFLMTIFFPSRSKLDVEQSTRRQRPSVRLDRIGSPRSLSSSTSASQSRTATSSPSHTDFPPSRINWLPNNPQASTSQPILVIPTPPVVPAPRKSSQSTLVRRSASMSALVSSGSSQIGRHPSNLSLQLDASSSRDYSDYPTLLYVQPLSPIYEVHSPSTSNTKSDEANQQIMEPTTPASLGMFFS